MPLSEHGLEWIQPILPVAHPLDGGDAATLDDLGEPALFFRRKLKYLAARWPSLLEDVLGPIGGLPKHPLLMGRFGLTALPSAARVARVLFDRAPARAFFAGVAAHSVLPLDMSGSAAIAWVLTIAAQAGGWPIPKGGAQKIADALVSYFQSLGGVIEANHEVRSLREFPRGALIFCDITPRQLLRIAGDRLPPSYARRLERFRYGPGVFKLDWALREPIPWRNAECRRAGTVHLGGTLEEIAHSEQAAWEGRICSRPFVLLTQPSLFDDSRAPQGQHTAWAYCHVPHGSTEDMTKAIEAQVERFAPGFSATILARHAMSTRDLEAHNANLIGGDIVGGVGNLRQLFFRPTASLYETALPGLFLCSSSTPPGGGVHGMCGYHAVRAALPRRTY